MRIGIGGMRVARHIVVNVVCVIGAEHVVLPEEAECIGVGTAGYCATGIDSTRVHRILLSLPDFIPLDKIVRSIGLYARHLCSPEAIVQYLDMRDSGLHENPLVAEFMDVAVLNRDVRR